jgi:hypothetical protein
MNGSSSPSPGQKCGLIPTNQHDVGWRQDDPPEDVTSELRSVKRSGRPRPIEAIK